MKKVSIFNIKGGVGKTTSALNISACLSKQGKRVLLIDLDSQANTTMTMGAYDIEALSISELLLERDIKTKDVIRNTEIDNIDVLPSNIKLSFAERKILLDVSRSQQNRLKKALKEVENEYDYCIIDCPPSLNMITINALCASDEVLVPVKIDKYALDGLGYLIDSVEQIKEEFNPCLTFKGCFITMDTATTVNRKIKQELKNALKDKLFNTTIKQNVKVIESTFEERPVVFSSSKARASQNYNDLCKEIF